MWWEEETRTDAELGSPATHNIIIIVKRDKYSGQLYHGLAKYAHSHIIIVLPVPLAWGAS